MSTMYRFLATLAALLVWVVTQTLTCGNAWANPLSVGVRIQQDFYTPLVPVTKNFRPCFLTDPSGMQVLGTCLTSPEENRVPASDSAPPPPPPDDGPPPGAPPGGPPPDPVAPEPPPKKKETPKPGKKKPPGKAGDKRSQLDRPPDRIWARRSGAPPPMRP